MSTTTIPARHRAHPTAPPLRARRSRVLSTLRVTAALVSVLALTATGLGWWAVRGVLGGITISQALGADDPRSSGGAVNILLIGLDSRKDQNGDDLPQAILDKLHAGDSDSGGYNTNTLILAHITQDNHVVAFSIPRDDYVAVKGIPGYSHVKIKEAYGLKKADTEQRLMDKGVTDQHQLEAQGREAGRTATLAAVRDLTGVPIDYFAEINLAGFYDLAKNLGGIEVCLNHAVYDEYSGADFPAGRQTLDASQALAFVRQRQNLGNGDLDRTHRQQAFLVSVMRKLQDAGTFTDLSKLNSLMDIARKDIVLSTGWSQEQFQRIGDIVGGNVEYQTLPVLRYDNIDGQDVNIVDPPAIKAAVATAFGSSTTTATSTDARPSSTVDVINAGDTTGLAATISQELNQRGYTQGDVRNPFTGEPTETGVQYGPGSATDAQNLATLLGIASSPRLDNTLEPGHIRVVIGRDYNPPTTLYSADTSSTSTSASPSTGSEGTTTPTETPDQGRPVDGGGIPCVN
jgi:LCP family protein required for cell wall assembly